MSWVLSTSLQEQRSLVPLNHHQSQVNQRSLVPMRNHQSQASNTKPIPPAKSLRLNLTEFEILVKHAETLESCAHGFKDDSNNASNQDFRDAASFFRKLTDDLTNLVPIASWPTATTAVKAQEVFDTPELLEEMLLYLDTKEKMSAMKVQRMWRDTVLGSPKLKQALGLESDDKVKFLRSPFLPVDGPFENHQTTHVYPNQYPNGLELPCGGGLLLYSSAGYYSDHENEVLVSKDVTATIAKFQPTLKTGTRVDAMQLFNIPITKPWASVECSPSCSQIVPMPYRSTRGVRMEKSNRPEPVQLDFNGKCLTIGELKETAQRIVDTHKDCGLPKVLVITFHFPISLLDDDPIVKSKRQPLMDYDHPDYVSPRYSDEEERDEGEWQDEEQQALDYPDAPLLL